MANIAVVKLRIFVKDVLIACGVPDDQANLITDTIVYAHIHGKETHGLTRLSIYAAKIKRGLMSPKTQLETKQNTPVLATIDAQDGFGQIAAFEGMSLAMDMAKEYGIGVCGVRNSNNFGVAGYFSRMAVDNHMIGLIASASAPAIAPTGGSKAIFGTNPISIGFPTPTGRAPIIFDMAASEAARGKIRLAEKNGEKIPFGWALDQNGNPTDDPTEALKGTMVAIGGSKGYGIAMTIDILAGLMTGNLFGGEIKNLNHKTERSRHGHVIVAVDIEKVMPYDEYLMKIGRLINSVKACGIPGNVLMPGERSESKAQQNVESVAISVKVLEELEKLRNELGVKTSLI